MTRIYARRSPEDLFWSHVTGGTIDVCWEWTAAKTNGGYGLFSAPMPGGRRKSCLAHRWAYMALIGPLPYPLVIDHLCRNVSCVNPWHMEPVTQQVNLLRGDTFQARNAAKTECLRGHPYGEHNTGYQGGGRYCLTCHRDRARDRARRLRRADVEALAERRPA